MYFPYFRGRQYELLALRELSNDGLIKDQILPIIEPVRETSTLISTLRAFTAAKRSIGLVINPAVGDLKDDIQLISPLFKVFSNEAVFPVALINNDVSKYFDLLKMNNGIDKDHVLSIIDNRDYLDIYSKIYENSIPKFTLFPDERQIRRTVKGDRVLFEDRFSKQIKNANYPEDEFFSEDHLYFKSEGYTGFGDYSIVGKDFNEGGWAPYAVVLHIVYFAEDRTLRIHHFMSETNGDTSDVAGKFYEAVSKLAEWFYAGQEWQNTSGLQTFIDHYKNRTYPGLPTLKKLSIMHHLELVGKYLDGEISK